MGHVVAAESHSLSGVRLGEADPRSEGALHVEQGAIESLNVRADDNLLQHLTAVVHGDTLQLPTGSNVDRRPTQMTE